MGDDTSLGWMFWLKVMGIVIACGVGALLIFLLIGGAWARWGLLGALIFFGAVMLFFAWIYDHRHARAYDG